MTIADQLRAAAGAVTRLPWLGRGLPRAAHVGGLVFHPALGAVVGALAGMAGRIASPSGDLAAAAVAVAVLAAMSPARPPAGTWMSVFAIACVAKLWAVATLPASGRMTALVLAAMLGRWATVVQCYGGRPASPEGAAARLVGRARLREFGWASAVAFASTLAALDAAGLLVVLAAALTTVGVRSLAYWRTGGVNGRVLAASCDLVETVTLVVLAGLARP